MRPPRAFRPFLVEIGGVKYELHRDRGVPRVYRRTPRGSLVRVRDMATVGKVLRVANHEVRVSEARQAQLLAVVERAKAAQARPEDAKP